jgi:hypothetical protein
MAKILACALLLGSVAAVPASGVQSRQSGPTVTLDYATYQGVAESDSGLNIWKGYVYPAPGIAH